MVSESSEWNPEPNEKCEDWEVIATDRCGTRHVVFVSSLEENKDKATFIVAEADAVCDAMDER